MVGAVRAPFTNVMISFLLIEEGEGYWSAQCLEYDIAAQAKTLSDLFYELEKTLVAHIAVHEAEGLDPFESVRPAPQRYWEMFYNAKLHVMGDRAPFRAPAPLRHIIPEAQFRVADKRAA